MTTATRETDNAWLEAEILERPLTSKALKERGGPVTLVRRRHPLIVGSRGEELIHLPGLSVISTFTGIGGMDLGVEQAGMCVLVQHEWDQMCCETLIANRPRCFRHAALIQGDIRETPTSMLLEEANLRVGETHVVTGGPPCQGFSTAGRRKATDPRNTMIFQFLRVVREAQPHFFIFENVPGFLTLSKGQFLKAFLQDAYSSYYELVYGILNACEYHVPQTRNRVFCMGTRRDLFECDGVLGSLPKPQCFGKRDLKFLELSDQFPLLEAEHRLRMRAPGIRYFPDRPILVPPAPSTSTEDIGRTKRFLEFYRKLEKEEPDRLVNEPVDSLSA